MKPTLILIDIWPLPSSSMHHLDAHLAMRHNIAALVDAFTDRHLPVYITNSSVCLPSDPPELARALRRSGNLVSDIALSPDGYITTPRFSGTPWPMANPVNPSWNAPLVYAGYAADYSLGYRKPWGYLQTEGRHDTYLVEGATLVLSNPRDIPSRWEAWKRDPMGGAPLPTRTLSFLHDHAKRHVTGIIEAGEVGEWLDHLPPPPPRPPAPPITLVSVPFSYKEGTADTTRMLNALGSWICLDPQPEIVLLCEDDSVAEYGSMFPGVRCVKGIETNQLGDLSLRSIFQIGDQVASSDLICYIDSDVILLPHTMDVLAYCADRYDPGTYSLCAGRWSIPTGSLVDYDDPTWPDVLRSSILRSHDVGSDFTIYPRGVLGDMPPFSIGKGWWDGWRMARLLQLGLRLVNVQDLQFALHQDHGHRRSGHPGTGHNVRLCEASGLEYVWIRDVKEKVSREEFDEWLNR